MKDDMPTPNPLSWYAETKLQGEKIVDASKLKWAILRTIIVYGIVDNMSRSNIVLWAKDALTKGQKLDLEMMPAISIGCGSVWIISSGTSRLIWTFFVPLVSAKRFFSVEELSPLLQEAARRAAGQCG